MTGSNSRRALRWLLVLVLAMACGKQKGSGSQASSRPSGSAAAPASTLFVDHGELDTETPKDAPELAAKVIAATIYKVQNVASRRLGYVRLGGRIRRDREPSSKGLGCKGDWYRVYPVGYACTDDFTTDLEDPLIRAASKRPDLSKPLPYRYGFVRATAPQYLRIPTRAEQDKSEFKLEEHLAWYRQNRAEVQQVQLGANDVALDARGLPWPGNKLEPARLSTALSLNELLGADGPQDRIPFWLADGKRHIPNVSGFDVPEYAVFADRVRRKTGLSLVDAFMTRSDGLERRFAVTVDLRLIPATKIKPDTGSPFHGIALNEKVPLPVAWVLVQDAQSYELIRDRDAVRAVEPIPKRVIVPLSGSARIKAGSRYYQTAKDKTRWLRADQLGIVASPPAWPEPAQKGQKWIDVSLRQQTLVLYEGKMPVYATLVSTGRDRLGDPKTSLATPQGSFRIRSKHLAAAMDSQENSSVAGGTRANTASTANDEQTEATRTRLLAAERAGETLDQEDQRRLANIKKGRDPEYGVTRRRGSAGFELRDVPWIQYFASGYALHGAYWHDVFGIPRSHGCINLAPVDARFVFLWTDPPLPEGWHGINVGEEMGEGTPVIVRE